VTGPARPPDAAVSWQGFAADAPDLAARARALIEGSGVVLVGTVRADGSPRISPVEALFHDGELWLGMMPASLKAADLERDPRCTVHSLITDRRGDPGEFKAHGRADRVSDPDAYASYGAALAAQIGFHPGTGGYPLFVFRLTSGAMFVTGERSRTVTRWRSGAAVEVFEQTA
jgi:hypothetical protein